MFSLPVQVAFITQTNSFVAAGLSGGTQTLTFDEFDPALGTLDEVTVTFTNTFAVSATGSTPSLFASVFVLGPASVVYLDPGAPVVTPLIDVNLVAGALSSNINTFTHSETHTLTGSTAQDDFLDNYIGTGTFDGVLQIGEIGLSPANDIIFT
jgi:hypothetical protein